MLVPNVKTSVGGTSVDSDASVDVDTDAMVVGTARGRTGAAIDTDARRREKKRTKATGVMGVMVCWCVVGLGRDVCGLRLFAMRRREVGHAYSYTSRVRGPMNSNTASEHRVDSAKRQDESWNVAST